MGCGPSKEAAAAVSVEAAKESVPPRKCYFILFLFLQTKVSWLTHHFLFTVWLTPSPDKTNSKNTATSTQEQEDSLLIKGSSSNKQLKPLSDHTKKSSEDRRHDWKIRPGYSSGASSYDGSEIEEEDVSTTSDINRSGILDLVNLRQEMQERGDIATGVVRIEVRNFARNA